MFSRDWVLGLTPEPDPAKLREQLWLKINCSRAYVAIMVAIFVGMGWYASAHATRRIPWEQLSFALCWGLLALLAIMMPGIVGHTGWPAARRRLIVRLVWAAAVLLALAGAWDFALFNDRRWGVFFAWVGLFTGFGIGLALLGLIGWFSLAGAYQAQLAFCACPPPLKRWMRTTPLPRSVYGPHVCPPGEAAQEPAADPVAEATPADGASDVQSSAA